MNNEEIQIILYKNEFQMTCSLRMEYIKKTKRYKLVHIPTVVLGSIFILLSIISFLCYFYVIKDISLIYDGILSCILGIVFILIGPFAIYEPAKKYVILMEMARKNNPEAEMGISFYNEVIVTTTRNKVKYNQIKKIILSKNLIILQGDNFGDGYTEGRQEKYLVLKKGAFTIGSEKEFLEFLIEKTKIKL